DGCGEHADRSRLVLGRRAYRQSYLASRLRAGSVLLDARDAARRAALAGERRDRALQAAPGGALFTVAGPRRGLTVKNTRLGANTAARHHSRMYGWHGLAIGSSAESAHVLRNICPAGVHEVRDCAQLRRQASGTGSAIRPDEVIPACAGVIATEWSARSA